MAISVVVAVDPIGDDLVGRITDRMASLVIADGAEPDSDMGPVITASTATRSPATSPPAREAGAAVVVDGRGLPVAGRRRLLHRPHPARPRHHRHDRLHATRSSARCCAWCGSARYDEAVALVNANAYGNGVALFTRDGGAARRFQYEVEAGMVGINVPIPVPMAYYSFGGWNQSLFGDTHMHGTEGVHFYTRGKVVTTRWPTARHGGGPDLGFPTNT